MTNPDPETKTSRQTSSIAAEVFLGDEEAIREQAEIAEIRSMLDRIDRDLTVEEALTRQLMVRHGL